MEAADVLQGSVQWRLVMSMLVLACWAKTRTSIADQTLLVGGADCGSVGTPVLTTLQVVLGELRHMQKKIILLINWEVLLKESHSDLGPSNGPGGKEKGKEGKSLWPHGCGL